MNTPDAVKREMFGLAYIDRVITGHDKEGYQTAEFRLYRTSDDKELFRHERIHEIYAYCFLHGLSNRDVKRIG